MVSQTLYHNSLQGQLCTPMFYFWDSYLMEQDHFQHWKHHHNPRSCHWVWPLQETSERHLHYCVHILSLVQLLKLSYKTWCSHVRGGSRRNESGQLAAHLHSIICKKDGVPLLASHHPSPWYLSIAYLDWISHPAYILQILAHLVVH